MTLANFTVRLQAASEARTSPPPGPDQGLVDATQQLVAATERLANFTAVLTVLTLAVAATPLAIWWLQNRQQRRVEQAALRLVWMEMVANIAALNAGMAISPPRLVVDDSAWRSHAGVVAHSVPGPELMLVVAPHTMVPAARVAFSGTDVQDTVRDRPHGNDYAMLKDLKDSFARAEGVLRPHAWNDAVGNRLAAALKDQQPDPSPHKRRSRFVAVLLAIGRERLAVVLAWVSLLPGVSRRGDPRPGRAGPGAPGSRDRP